MEIKKIRTDSVVYRKDLYPRLRPSPETVQQYAEDLSVLPPIEVNQHGILIDGWHRWTAHIKCGMEEIPATVTVTGSEAQILEFAISRNSAYGLQLSLDDKRDMARRIYHGTPERERDGKKAQIAQLLSVSERSVRSWLSRLDQDAKEAMDKRIFDLWLSCRTGQEIAEETGCNQATVSRRADSFMQDGRLSGLHKAEETRANFADAGFEIPLYNVWKFREKSSILESLLYMYTQPGDIVVDPFAGGGSTIDVCRRRFRRHYVSDRLPIPERAAEIRQHDIRYGLPGIARWKDVRLVYLDPPKDPDTEGEGLAETVNAFGRKVQAGYIALLIGNGTDDFRGYVPRAEEMYERVRLPIAMRIFCPHDESQCSAQAVQWARENREVLVISREILVWRVSRESAE